MSRADGIVGAVLFVAALAFGTWYVPQVVAAGGRPQYYQSFFGSAVMLACGHGYVNPQTEAAPELTAFLALERDEIACTDSLASTPQAPASSLQKAYRYLMTAVGWTWRLQGRVAWSALAPLYGTFYAATIVLLFAVFRVGMGTAIAASLTMLLALSPLHVMYLAHLRDYSKAPFILALVLFAARLVQGPLPFRKAILLAAGAGLVTGFGMGFRNDLLVAVPAFVAVLLAFLPHELFRRGWRNAALAVVYLVAFAGALSPMWSIYRTGGGNSSQHLILLGLSEPFSEELGLDNDGMYQWVYGYRDEYAHAMISGHATRRLGATSFLKIYGADYDRSGADYLAQVVNNFPADMLARAYASALRVIELPYNQKLMLPHAQYVHVPHAILVARDRFQRALAPAWPLIVLAALFALSLISIRIGLFAVLLVFYLSAYPALQFAERHYFHLEFIGWWAFGLVVSLASTALRASLGDGIRPWLVGYTPARGWRRASIDTTALLVAMGVLLVAPLLALRAYQQPHLRQLFRQYLAAPADEFPPVARPTANGYVSFAAPMSNETLQLVQSMDAVRPELFIAEFGGTSCNSLKLDAIFRYQAAQPRFDFSRAIVVQPPLSATPIKIVFPAYFHRPPQASDESSVGGDMSYRFTGLEISETAQSCLTRFGRLTETRELPLLMELRLPPRWDEANLFQTIKGIESRVNGEDAPVVSTAPADLEVGRLLLMSPNLEPLDASAIVHKSPTLDTTGPAWVNRGVGGVGGKGPFLYLFEMQPRLLEEGRLALVQGYITRGGISFGLVSGGVWIAQAAVTRPGPFSVVVRVPTTGTHSLVFANNHSGASLQSDLRIDRVGWIRQ